MIQRLRNLALAAAGAAVLATSAVPRPAAASTASTLTTVLGAAAVVGGIILYNNYQHKKQAANQVVGYTRNGGTILGDGRIVMPNGQTIVPDANGQYPWGQPAYYNPNFNPNAVAFDQSRSGRYDSTHRHDNGLHRGWYKDNNRDDNRGQGNDNRGDRGNSGGDHGDRGNHGHHDN